MCLYLCVSVQVVDFLLINIVNLLVDSFEIKVLLPLIVALHANWGCVAVWY